MYIVRYVLFCSHTVHPFLSHLPRAPFLPLTPSSRHHAVKEDFTAEQVENMLDNPHTQLVSDEVGDHSVAISNVLYVITLHMYV